MNADLTRLMAATFAAVHALRKVKHGGKLTGIEAGYLADQLQDAANDVDALAFSRAMIAGLDQQARTDSVYDTELYCEARR